MKRILDRFDNSPLWIRLVTVLSLSFILVAGLYTVKKNTAAQVTTEIQPAKKTGSLPVKKETKEEKEKKEEKKNILTTNGKFCYNNRRYFLLLVSQECTGTC